MLLVLSALFPASAAEIDEIGGADAYTNRGGELKLAALYVTEAAAITAMEFATFNDGDVEGGIDFVLYVADENDDTRFVLADTVAAETPGPGDEEWQWATAEGFAWVVEPGRTYTIGAYLDDDWYYAYSDRSDSPWFADVEGGMFVEENGVVDSFSAEIGDYVYWMVLESEDADVDDDGVIAATYGGLDCDDADAAVGEPTGEVAYDGIDQDCDGADLVDVDGDGAEGSEVGGPDCDDADAAVAPGLDDPCGDGIDGDCSGADAACGDGDDTGCSADDVACADGEMTIKVQDACTGCAAGGGGAAGWGLLGALAALLSARSSRRG